MTSYNLLISKGKIICFSGFFKLYFTLYNSDSFLLDKITVAPLSANYLANSSPIPELAPVIQTNYKYNILIKFFNFCIILYFLIKIKNFIIYNY